MRAEQPPYLYTSLSRRGLPGERERAGRTTEHWEACCANLTEHIDPGRLFAELWRVAKTTAVCLSIYAFKEITVANIRLGFGKNPKQFLPKVFTVRFLGISSCVV